MIIQKSSIIIFVVGIIDEREKKFIEMIKDNCPKNSSLIIIHNLFENEKEMENEKKKLINIINQNEKQIFLVEEYEKDSNNTLYIPHVFLFKEKDKNNEHNNKVFDFLEKQINFSTKYSEDRKNINNELYFYQKQFLDFLKQNSEKYFKSKIEPIEINETIIECKDTNKEIKLNEEELNKFNPEIIQPKYLVKVNTEENKLIIILEISNYKNLKTFVQLKKDHYLIIVTGEVKFNIPENTEKIYSNLEEGQLYLPIKIDYEKCLLKKSEPSSIEKNEISFDIFFPNTKK